jgi:pimeloyl-ACP methyl ester carboxylesterase
MTPSLGVDAVILHHGVGGNFYSSSFFGQVSEWLVAEGCTVLRVNNRGHDFAYNTPAGPRGAAFEVVAECAQDWRAWIDLAFSLGHRRIAVWGHSLGALKTIYYLATERDDRVVCAIASSPPRFSYRDYVNKAGAERFLAFMDRAQELVADGQANAIFPANVPTSVLLSAATYVDKYGPAEQYDLLQHLPNVRVPMLVTIGALEGAGLEASDWFPFGGLAPKVADLASRIDNVSFELVEGANHSYAGVVQDLWRLARAKLAAAAAATPA